MEPIKIVRIAYKYDLTIQAQAIQYETLCNHLKKNGYRKFAALWAGKPGVVFPDRFEDATLDASCIFNDQFNTIEGERVFDWYEPVFANSQIRMGYYIFPLTKVAIDAYRNTLVVCGYCGHKEEKSNKVFCDKCLGNEYLKESELYLTRLISLNTPFSERGNNVQVPPSHRENFRIAQLEQKIAYIRKQSERRRAKIAELKENLKKKIDLETYKCDIQCKVLAAGFDIDNLIYYPHKNEWVWGWHKKVSIEESENIRNAGFDFDVTIMVNDGTSR